MWNLWQRPLTNVSQVLGCIARSRIMTDKNKKIAGHVHKQPHGRIGVGVTHFRLRIDVYA